MVMMKYFFTAALFCYSSFVFCQKTDYSAFEGTKINITKENSLEEPFFYIYAKRNGRVPYIVDKNSIAIDNSTPENLIAKFYNIKSANEVPDFIDKQYSPMFAPKLYFKDKNDTNRYHIELIHKLTFIWHGYETAIVKLKEIKNDSITLSINTVQLHHLNNRWYLVLDNSINEIDETIRYVLPNFFRKVSWVGYDSVNKEIVNYVVSENNMNITRIYELIIKYKTTNNFERLKEFCDVLY